MGWIIVFNFWFKKARFILYYILNKNAIVIETSKDEIQQNIFGKIELEKYFEK